MAEKLKLEVVTPYKVVFSGEVDEITAPGELGEFGVLPGHAPLLTALRVGEFCFKNSGVSACMAFNKGYLEVENDRVIILVETAERAEEIDVERARAAQGRAEEALKRLPPDDAKFKVYEAALQRALIRMQVAAKAARK